MAKIKTLSLDLETFSDIDLNKCGVYKYASSPYFHILLFGYAVDGGEVHVIDLAQGEKIPQDIIDALTDDSVTKWAFNANFERVCLSRYLSDLGVSLDPFHDRHPLSTKCARFLNLESWRCSMVWSAYMGLPLSLKGVGGVLKLEDQKMDEGKALIKYFSVPCAATVANAGRTRNLPSDAPDKWELFKSYNKRDVEVEMAIQKCLSKFPMPESVWEEYRIDQEINDRGVRRDIDLVYKEVAAALETALDELRDVLNLRRQLARSSVKKYQAMENAACEDGRARGMFQFYGANRTGRWAGRLIQLQNLPQNHLPDLAEARELVKSADYDAVKMLYGDVPDTLSQLIRTAFVPKENHKFYVADFSAIEARVIAWYVGEKWRQEVFESGGDIYCASASQMFHVPVVKHGVNGHLRQKGKIAELALGYGGSVGVLKAMGALEMGLSEDELQPLVTIWRESNPRIVDYWWQVDAAIKQAIREHGPARVGSISLTAKSGMLFITLPSGRQLAYVKLRIGVNRFGGESVTYMGVDAKKKWSRIESYGPKFVENITQTVSRDILASAMRTLSDCFIVVHVHDKLIIEAEMDTSVRSICERMGRTPP